MLKFFLIGWVCIGLGQDKKCLRMASEIVHDTYDDCNGYFKMVKEDLSDLDDYITMEFNCVQAGSIEDTLYKIET